MRRAMGPAMPMLTAMFPVVSHKIHPTPAPPPAAKSAMAAERPNRLSFGFFSIVSVRAMWGAA
jgi:hypothetical protein